MVEKFENNSENPKILRRLEYEGGEALIRYPEESDLGGVLDVVMDKRTKWKDEGKKIDVRQIDDKEMEFRKKVIEHAKEGKMIFLVVEADGRVCGYIDIRRNTDIDLFSPTAFQKNDSPDYDKATVVDLTVHSNYRGKHFGQELLGAGIGEAKNVLGAKVLELQTDEDNHDARKAYKNSGFIVKSIGPETKKRDDKIVLRVNMEKQL